LKSSWDHGFSELSVVEIYFATFSPILDKEHSRLKIMDKNQD